MNQRYSRNNYIDACRTICSFLVIFLHFSLPGIFGKITLPLTRIAVPFFFAVSGYYFYKDDKKEENRVIGKRIIRLLKLFACSELVYFSFYLFLEFNAFGFGLHSIKSLLDAYVSNYSKNIPSWPIALVPLCNEVGWFLLALCAVYLIMYISNKVNMTKHLWIFSIIYLCIHMIIRRIRLYMGTDIVISERFILCLPLFFFLLGYQIHKNQEKLANISMNKLVGIFISGCFLSIAECFTFTHTIYIGTILCTFSLILICTVPRKAKESTFICLLSRIGQHHTDFIYIMHLLIINNVGHILSKVMPKLVLHPLYAWALPVFGCIFVTLCAVFFRAIVERIKRVFVNSIKTP